MYTWAKSLSLTPSKHCTSENRVTWRLFSGFTSPSLSLRGFKLMFAPSGLISMIVILDASWEVKSLLMIWWTFTETWNISCGARVCVCASAQKVLRSLALCVEKCEKPLQPSCHSHFSHRTDLWLCETEMTPKRRSRTVTVGSSLCVDCVLTRLCTCTLNKLRLRSIHSGKVEKVKEKPVVRVRAVPTATPSIESASWRRGFGETHFGVADEFGVAMVTWTPSQP